MTESTRRYTGPRQLAALAAINSYWKHYSEAPTRSELGRALGISKVSAHLLIQKLARSGLVVVHPKMARGVEVVEDYAATA